MNGELEGQVLSGDVEGVKEVLRRREEQGREPPRDGLASSFIDEDAGSIHKGYSIHKGQSLSPNYFLNNYYVFGLVNDAVGFRDEKDSALAF